MHGQKWNSEHHQIINVHSVASVDSFSAQFERKIVMSQFHLNKLSSSFSFSFSFFFYFFFFIVFVFSPLYVQNSNVLI